MPKGVVEVMPEMMQCLNAWLPLGVTIVSQEPYGGTIRVEVQGDEIEEGRGYQMIVQDEPMKRTITMVANPHG